MTNKETQELIFTGTESNILYVNSKTLSALIIPNDPAFSLISLTFKAGVSESVLYPLRDMQGDLITVTIDPGSVYALDLPFFAGLAYLRLSASGSLTGKQITAIYREL
jgi:hypothetical protein